MTKDQVVKMIAFRLGNVRGMDTIIETEIESTINRLENESFQPWFLLSENNEFQMTVGEGRVPVPRGFLAEYDDCALYVKTDSGSYDPLTKLSAEEVRLKYQNQQGAPEGYALTNKYFRVYPAPDKEYLLELLFYRRSGTIEGDNNPWLEEAADLIVYETASHILMARKDKRYVQMEQLAQEQKVLLMQRHVAREEANREVVMGGD
jgi:hypothetical protein